MRTYLKGGYESLGRIKGGELPIPVGKGANYAPSYPILYIDTENSAPIATKTDYVNCHYRLVDTQGTGMILLDQDARIRGRGNSTWVQPKKPYKVKLTNSANILGMPKSKDWALLANYLDPARIRNAVAFEMARRTSLVWAPHSIYCEVILNGSYNGLYQLIESVEVDTPRLNITKIKATDLTGRNLTGGYLWEIDVRMEENNETGFRTRIARVPIIADTPDLLVPEQFVYSQTTLQNLENRLYAADFADAVTGYKPLIDLDAWCDWYLLVETTANNDSGFGASIKLYKDRDPTAGVSKIFIGPPWDYDLSYSIGALVNPHPVDQWWTRRGATWIVRMLEDPAFLTRLKQRWLTFQAALENPQNSIYTWVSSYAGGVSQSMARESARWGLGSAADINNWLQGRIAWLDSQFTTTAGKTDTTPPAAPTGVVVSGSGSSRTIGWEGVTSPFSGGDVNGYRVLADGVIVAETAFPYSDVMNSVTVTGVTGDPVYTVQAKDAAGNWSTPAGVAPTGPSTEHTIFNGQQDIGFSWNTDGGGGLAVANAFYTSVGDTSTDSWRFVGGRIWVGGSPGGETVTVWATMAAMGARPENIIQQKVITSPVQGWNVVQWDTPIAFTPGQQLWVGYQWSNGAYYAHKVLTQTAPVQASDGAHLYLARANANAGWDNGVEKRAYYNIGGNQPFNDPSYGIDIIVDEGP